jgi:hypothetical protein
VAEVKVYVAGGHVYCPIHRDDRDVLLCAGCARLRKVDERSSPPFIVCELDDPSLETVADPGYAEWWYQHHRRGTARPS